MSITEGRGTNGGGWVGQALRRKEDPPLIMGQGNYVDNHTLPGVLHVAIVRSPEAHARVASIDTSAARAREDVVAVFTGEDMGDLLAPLPCAWVPPGGRRSREGARGPAVRPRGVGDEQDPRVVARGWGPRRGL